MILKAWTVGFSLFFLPNCKMEKKKSSDEEHKSAGGD